MLGDRGTTMLYVLDTENKIYKLTYIWIWIYSEVYSRAGVRRGWWTVSKHRVKYFYIHIDKSPFSRPVWQAQKLQVTRLRVLYVI